MAVVDEWEAAGPAGSRRQSGRVPPHNLEAEASLLGAMLLSRDAVAAALENVEAHHFYRPIHQMVFEAMWDLYRRSEPVDAVATHEELRRRGQLETIGGPAFLGQLAGAVPATANAAHYARIVRETFILRELIRAGREIAEMAFEPADDVPTIVDRAENVVYEVSKGRSDVEFSTMSDLMTHTFQVIEHRYDHKAPVTGLSSGFPDLDNITMGFNPGNLVMVAARPSMGKCTRWDTPLIDPRTGAVTTIESAYRCGRSRRRIDVASLDLCELKVVPSQAIAFVDDGVKPVFTLRTRLGREVTTTATHPFLTPVGWRPLSDLTVGLRIAVPRVLPFFGSEALSRAEVVMVALLIGDGCLTGPTPSFTTKSAVLAAELSHVAETLGCSCREYLGERRAPQYSISGKTRVRNPVTEMLRRHGLMGHGSHTKFVPDAVYRLPKEQVALFLNRLFATDGSVWWAKPGYGRISYSSVSKALITGVQHLLLRFGINAQVRKRAVKYKAERRTSYELEIMNAPDIRTFAREIGILGKDAALMELVERVKDTGVGYARDTLPIEVWDVVLDATGFQSWRSVSAAVARPLPHNWHVHKRAPRRETTALLGQVLTDFDLATHAESDIYWDEIVSIEYAGEEQVYDLTVPGDHNFVAADIFVHNTALALNFAANAALRNDPPQGVAVFSLEMSSEEVAERLLCAEANVDSKRVRTGFLQDSDWPRITRAAGKLEGAPIFIDESPFVSVLEMRAKCRRIASRHPLGLVVVDYVQLMEPRDARQENRATIVSEISRGLKILARELKLPVVACAQLNRAPEARTDKRPLLGDLRESGGLEQDSDVVMFIYRDSYYNPDSADKGLAEIIVGKNRNGPTGHVKLSFLDHCTRFESTAPS